MITKAIEQCDIIISYDGLDVEIEVLPGAWPTEDELMAIRMLAKICVEARLKVPFLADDKVIRIKGDDKEYTFTEWEERIAASREGCISFDEWQKRTEAAE
jgi:hypothetical protein